MGDQEPVYFFKAEEPEFGISFVNGTRHSLKTTMVKHIRMPNSQYMNSPNYNLGNKALGADCNS